MRCSVRDMRRVASRRTFTSCCSTSVICSRADAPPTVAIERDYDPSLPALPLDRNLIMQAMLNLGRNALQALAQNASGKGRIVLRTRALTNVNIGARRHRVVASVQFEDNGPGVPDHLRETLFYPLVTGRADGTGLGLAVAQDLASRHDGLIEFDSRPGLTLFTILLPLHVVHLTKPLNVWLVDDDASIRWVLERALRQGGMAPTAFDQADTALAALAPRAPRRADHRHPHAGPQRPRAADADSREPAGAAGHRDDRALGSRQRGRRVSGRRVRISAEAVRHR